MTRNYLLTSLALLIGLVNPFVAATGYAEQEKVPVKIGIIAPLTGNGAHIGTEITRTIKVWSQKAAPISLHYQYDFVFEDGKAATDNSPTTAFRKLVGVDGAKFIIVASSGEVLQVGPLAEREHVLVIGVFSSHPAIKSLGDYVFRTFPDVERGVQTLVGFIRKHDDGPVALLTEDHPFNQGIKVLLQRYLGKDLIMAEDYKFEEMDLKPSLLHAKTRNPKSYYFNCSHPITCAAIVNQAHQLGLNGHFYSYLHIDNPEFLKAAGPNADGVLYISTPDVSSSSAAFREFLAEYKKLYPEGPTNDFLTRTTYDAATAFFDGIEARAPEVDQVRDYLKSYKKQGALGDVGFDANGDIEGVDYVVKKIVAGKPEVAR
jgi:branched-chain amino acid transport system substrate-binding protein